MDDDIMCYIAQKCVVLVGFSRYASSMGLKRDGLRESFWGRAAMHYCKAQPWCLEQVWQSDARGTSFLASLEKVGVSNNIPRIRQSSPFVSFALPVIPTAK